MAYENILVEKKNSIAYVTVNRPKVLNALNMATMEDLRSAFHDIKKDVGVRVVILTGSSEKAFIAGADIAANCRGMMPCQRRSTRTRGSPAQPAIRNRTEERRTWPADTGSTRPRTIRHEFYRIPPRLEGCPRG